MKKLAILLALLLASCLGQPQMITSKHMEGETYWISRYKQQSLQIDSTLYHQLKELNAGQIRVEPAKYYFTLDGKDRVEVDSYTYGHQTEGEYFKQ